MPRPIWTGAIGFGLVNVPVRMYSATQTRDVQFHEVDQRTGKRIRHKRVAEGSDREVDYDEVAKGYEVAKGEYVVLSRKELEAADPEKTRTIEIESIVDLTQIDPIYFEKSYYLGPEKAKSSQRAYALMLRALEETGRVAVARFVMRSKEYLACVRPSDGVLVLETMFFPDEIRRASETVPDVPVDAKVEKKDLDLAKRLIDGLLTQWDPERFEDTYRKRILSIIEQKARGKEITRAPAEEPDAPASLMDALRASVEALEGRKTPRRAGGTRRKSRARKAG